MWSTGGGIEENGSGQNIKIKGKSKNVVMFTTEPMHKTLLQFIFSETSLYTFSADAALLAVVEEEQREQGLGEDRYKAIKTTQVCYTATSSSFHYRLIC